MPLGIEKDLLKRGVKSSNIRQPIFGIYKIKDLGNGEFIL